MSQDDAIRALEDLLAFVDANTCTHEETYRGGAIWTICRGCDCKWADDEGGFQPHEDSPEVAKARGVLALLSDRQEVVPVADGEMPGMWSASDFTGGDPDERCHAERAPVAWVIRDSTTGKIVWDFESALFDSKADAIEFIGQLADDGENVQAFEPAAVSYTSTGQTSDARDAVLRELIEAASQVEGNRQFADWPRLRAAIAAMEASR